jgi:uncharacterized membrane protein YfcA
MEPLVEIGPLTIVGILVAAYFAALVGGLSAFGSGLIMTLFIAPLFGAKAVIPIISVFMTFTNASRMWFFREGLDWHKVALVAGPGIPTSILGASVYVRIESNVIQILLGIMLIASIPLRRWLAGREIKPGPWTLMIAGAVLGFTTSIMLGTGILLLPLLLGAGLAGGALIGTDAAVAMITNATRAMMFGQLNVIDWRMMLLAVGMGIMTIPGTWSARWLIERTSVRIHTFLIEGILAIAGAVMIWGAFTG